MTWLEFYGGILLLYAAVLGIEVGLSTEVTNSHVK